MPHEVVPFCIEVTVEVVVNSLEDAPRNEDSEEVDVAIVTLRNFSTGVLLTEEGKMYSVVVILTILMVAPGKVLVPHTINIFCAMGEIITNLVIVTGSCELPDTKRYPNTAPSARAIIATTIINPRICLLFISTHVNSIEKITNSGI